VEGCEEGGHGGGCGRGEVHEVEHFAHGPLGKSEYYSVVLGVGVFRYVIGEMSYCDL
jgi:hypothetical protein